MSNWPRNYMLEAIQKTIDSYGAVALTPRNNGEMLATTSLGRVTPTTSYIGVMPTTSHGGVMATTFHGGMIPSTSYGGLMTTSSYGSEAASMSNQETNDDFASNGSEVLESTTSTVRPVVRSGLYDNAPLRSRTIPPVLPAPVASTSSDYNEVYQPYQARPITAANAEATDPECCVKFVKVTRDIEIPKKKFLPRCLPLPVGSKPEERGRPIIGRGASLYDISPKPGTSTTAQTNGNGTAAAAVPADVPAVYRSNTAPQSSACYNAEAQPSASACYDTSGAGQMQLWPLEE